MIATPQRPSVFPCRAVVLGLLLGLAPLRAQSRPAPTVDPVGTGAGQRPLPGPVYESPAFSRAVLRGTRTRTGRPGGGNWVQHARYRIRVALDPATHLVTGHETVTYLNRSPDSLQRLMVHLRQNVFAEGVARREAAPITGGIALGDVAVDGEVVPAALGGGRGGRPTGYRVDGTVMTIPLVQPLLPGDSLTLGMTWSFHPAESPSDGRQGWEDRVYQIGYWYPQVAVYDDVDGWVADPYLLEAEFYMDPADYDVRITVPRGWVVGATGTLRNPQEVLSRETRDSLIVARRSGRVVRILTPGPAAARHFVGSGSTATWHFIADSVRDFVWGTSDTYAWDATRALLPGPGQAAPDTVDIHSFFRLIPRARAWEQGGARFTRDAIEQLSRYLWTYPWPQMTSMEGVLTSGGMEYPMLTVMTPYTDTLSLAGDLMHETGHMWFPMQVGSNETRAPWMDEGFTQFNVAQAMRPLYGEPRQGGRPNDSEPGQRALYFRAARAGQDAPLMWPGDDYPRSLYVLMQYDKTAQVLGALRGVLGEAPFHQALREYGRRWIGRHPAPWDFFNTIEDVTGQDLDWFWESWFAHGWALDQAIEGVVPDGDSVTITIVDRGLVPMPVDLAISRADGTTTSHRIPVARWLTGARRTTLTVPSRPAVTAVVIDPDGHYPDLDRRNQQWRAAAGSP
ncbi:MAG TPA: M1 family metallopeptidase [Gemmatimonadales bacterium]|nr:M1 family metallopeptidase [Gemmatimonadales bacterium]